MSSVESSKTMAMVGSILLILGVVPYGGWVLGIIGVILLLMGIKGFSTYYQDPEMYQNTLKGMIYYIIALVALGVSMVALFAFVITIFFIFVGIAVFIVGLIVAFIFYILAAKRLRMTFNTLAQKTGEHSFETAGYLIWLGAILTIIFVGAILIFVAWIFATIGFISMKLPGQTSSQPPSGYAPPPPPPAAAQPAQAARFCPNCGAPVQPGATFCPSCGKQLPSA
jgi:uncharacterized membrane protein